MQENSTERLPYDLTAEAAMVGSCLLDGERIPAVRAICRPGDVLNPRLAIVWEALCRLSDEETPIDPVIVKDALKAAGTYSRLGDDPVGFLVEIMSSVPSAENAEFYAGTVARSGRACRLAQANEAMEGLLLHGDGWRNDEGITAAIDRLRTAAELPTETETVGVGSCMEQVMTNLARHQWGVRTGIWGIDDKNGGIYGGELVILAALTSYGKSSLALQIAAVVAELRPVLFVSGEMGQGALANRLLVQRTSIPLRELRGEGYRLNRDRVDAAVEQIKNLKLAFMVAGRLTPGMIRGAALRIQRKRKDLGLIVVDYLTLLRADRRCESRQQEVGEISAALKGLAVDLNVPVLALAQFNRSAANLSGGRQPSMYMLRESGQLEQDADAVWTLHRDKKDGDAAGDQAVDVRLRIEKAREGPTHDVFLRWQGNLTKFWQAGPNHTEIEIGVEERRPDFE